MKKLFFSFAILLSFSAQSQTKDTTIKNISLRDEIMKMDSLLFNVAFNQCDTVVFKKIISDDIEFYDDRTGLNTSKEIEIKSLIEKCSKKENLTRVLKNCIVNKLGDFGAVQIGEHYFLLNNVIIGTASFIHIWQRTKDGWLLKRIISYEHASTHN